MGPGTSVDAPFDPPYHPDDSGPPGRLATPHSLEVSGPMRFAALCMTLLLLGPSCAKDDIQVAQKTRNDRQAESQPTGGGSSSVDGAGAPSGGTDAGAGGAAVASDGAAIPLKVSGIGGAEELERELAKLKDAQAQQRFEKAYRLTFTSDRGQRDYATARDLLSPVLKADPAFAPAYRTLGYAQFNLGDLDGSMQNYEKAVEVDPSYGEAHYAIAFMMVMPGGDLDRGFEHYRKAMQAGVADERSIGERFYKDRLQSVH